MENFSLSRCNAATLLATIFRKLGGFNLGYVNGIACKFQRAGYSYLLAFPLLRFVLIVEEVTRWLALRSLTCNQREVTILQLHDLACECFGILRILLRRRRRLLWRGLLWRLLLGLSLRRLILCRSASTSLRQQCRGECTKGCRQNQWDRPSEIMIPFHLIHPPGVVRVVSKADRLLHTFASLETAIGLCALLKEAQGTIQVAHFRNTLRS